MLNDIVGARHQIVRRHHNREQHRPQHRHAGQKNIGRTRHLRLRSPRTPRAAVNIVAQPLAAQRRGARGDALVTQRNAPRPVNLSRNERPAQLTNRKRAPAKAGLAGRADLGSKRGRRMLGFRPSRRTRKSQRMRPTPMTSGDILERLGLTAAALSGGSLSVRSPIDGAEIARIRETPAADMPAIIERAHTAFLAWREVPAPRRGELVRLLGEELRASKEALGALVTLEVGKIVSEGLGEVQEMIDICDFAVGLSRQLYGLAIASERPGHRMTETWHPLGPCAIISAFNFPVAVWSWNAALALVCGDSVIWKPSEKTPLSALATMKILERAIERFGPDAPEGLAQLVIGGPAIGEALAASKRVPIVSATGSTRMGSIVGPEGRGALRPPDPRTRRQQRDDRRPLRRSRHGGPGDRLFRRRHRGAALHLAAPGHRPSLDPRRSHPPAGQDLCEPADRRSAQRRGRWSVR